MTRHLTALPGVWYAADFSPVAVQRARQQLSDTPKPPHFFSARSTALPFGDQTFDLIIAADGLYSWDIDREARDQALKEIHRATSAGGHAIFTEHMRPRRFDEFISEIEASAFSIERTFFFYDRPAYQLESWFKSVQDWRIAKAIRGSVSVARVLSGIGRLFGTRGARHICVIARRD